MTWVFWGIVAAALAHVVEEYAQGFLIWFPRASRLRLTLPEVVVINILFVLLCVVAALNPRANPGFTMSVPGLILVNAALHTGGTIVFRRYAPGLVTALLLYVPPGAAALSVARAEG